MREPITIEQSILKKNADIAASNRAAIEARGAYAVGLTSAPGSGQTSLIERTLAALAPRLRIAVIEGDVQTDRDARRIAAFDVPVVQIVTNGTCHLEARMVQEALGRVPGELDLLLIENVGNLVCPASYDLGEHARVVITSTPEGEDKPIKYPALFRAADAVVLNKIDLLPHLHYDVAEARAFVGQVKVGVAFFQTSCATGEGIAEWVSWLEAGLAAHRKNRRPVRALA